MKQVSKRVILLLIAVILVTNSVLAITGSLGNSRMVLRLEKGEEVEKSLLIKNVNDVPIVVTLLPGGDLKEDVVIKDDNFTLSPGEEKKAYFTIKATKSGTTETKINVRFTPVEGKNSVGLSSTVIVITDGSGDTEETEEVEENNNSSLFDFNFFSRDKNATQLEETEESSSSFKFNPVYFLLGSTFLLAIVLVALLLYAIKKKSVAKRGKNKPFKAPKNEQ